MSKGGVTMAQSLSFMVKARLGRKVLPCQAPGCDISTNKRYKRARSVAGQPYIACYYGHAEAVYRRGKGKMPAAA